jgi:hypothetical protein
VFVAPPLFFLLWYSYLCPVCLSGLDQVSRENAGEVKGKRDETVSDEELEILLRIADELQYRQPADGFERTGVRGSVGD